MNNAQPQADAPRPRTSWKPLAGRMLEAILNRLLELDPDTRAELESLEGRRIELHLREPTLSLAILVCAARLRVGPVSGTGEADLALRASATAIATRAVGAMPGPASGKLHISGDAELARTLQRLLRDYDPDWEQPLVDRFGEAAGVGVSRILGHGFRSTRRLLAGLLRDVAEYLGEERRDIASGVELEDFNDAVDAVRDRIERLERRIGRLGRGVDGGIAR